MKPCKSILASKSEHKAGYDWNTYASVNANCCPMQIRGPPLNGKYCQLFVLVMTKLKVLAESIPRSQSLPPLGLKLVGVFAIEVFPTLHNIDLIIDLSPLGNKNRRIAISTTA